MPPLHLADAELAAVMTAASVLRPADRPAFLAEVAAALRAQGDEMIGVGLIHRVVVPIQRRYWGSPDLGTAGKYR
jgi:hypothetical protein